MSLIKQLIDSMYVDVIGDYHSNSTWNVAESNSGLPSTTVTRLIDEVINEEVISAKTVLMPDSYKQIMRKKATVGPYYVKPNISIEGGKGIAVGTAQEIVKLKKLFPTMSIVQLIIKGKLYHSLITKDRDFITNNMLVPNR